MSQYIIRRLVAIGNAEKDWDLADSISTYLVAFTYPWLTRRGLIDQPASRFLLTSQQRAEFADVLEEALRHLVQRLYEKPSERQLSIHRSRFERIEVDGSSYLVNYRTSVPGWLMYALFTHQQFVSSCPDVVITLAPRPPEQ